MQKLYVVTRADLPAGAQVAQSCHAAIAYVIENRVAAARWHADSNNLVCLSVPDEDALDELCDRLDEAGVGFVLFHEPDLSGSLTAIAVEPGGWRVLSNLPLTLRRAA